MKHLRRNSRYRKLARPFSALWTPQKERWLSDPLGLLGSKKFFHKYWLSVRTTFKTPNTYPPANYSSYSHWKMHPVHFQCFRFRDSASWYDLWAAAVALDGMCARSGKEGQAFSLGKMEQKWSRGVSFWFRACWSVLLGTFRKLQIQIFRQLHWLPSMMRFLIPLYFRPRIWTWKFCVFGCTWYKIRFKLNCNCYSSNDGTSNSSNPKSRYWTAQFVKPALR